MCNKINIQKKNLWTYLNIFIYCGRGQNVEIMCGFSRVYIFFAFRQNNEFLSYENDNYMKRHLFFMEKPFFNTIVRCDQNRLLFKRFSLKQLFQLDFQGKFGCIVLLSKTLILACQHVLADRNLFSGSRRYFFIWQPLLYDHKQNFQ